MINKETMADDKKPVMDRWLLAPDNGIIWDVENDKRLPHEDHVEMSGRLVSYIVRYGIDKFGKLSLMRKIVWPTLRMIPNNTHSSLVQEYREEVNPEIKVDGNILSDEKPYNIKFDGLLTICSRSSQKLNVIRTLFPSTEYGSVFESFKLKNTSSDTMNINIKPLKDLKILRGTYGIYMLEVEHNAPQSYNLRPGESMAFGITFKGRKLLEEPDQIDIVNEEAKRRYFISSIRHSLTLHTPDPLLNRAFDFAKVRTTESIYKTKSGLMHSPGGGTYYAAIWANDQAEYAAPFFPFSGDKGGIEASLNCFRLFRPFMGPDYSPIPSSIVAEGIDIWEGAGDRGDAAMYAYGASRFALEMGDRQIAEELWPAIEWCLEYCRTKMTPEGIIASDSDELEGRFPTGSANLSTSSLTYGGLRSAANLARSLGKTVAAEKYDSWADKLFDAIEDYFGANVEGYDTYRYYDGNKLLRSWICLPLTVGIMERKEGTIAALLSPKLWTEDGLATQSGDVVIWDRSTLYGLRGIFAAGDTENAISHFKYYTRNRLLGEHIPYPVEAYPEGGQRHLAAESALYSRVVIEGLFGITPTGFDSFICTPRLPDGWDNMALRSIKAFTRNFDLEIKRMDDKYKVIITMYSGQIQEFCCSSNETVEIKLR